jgi:hypothetical protein
MTTKQKTFDCVEMKRQAALRIYERIKDLTPEEQLAYWQQRDEQFRKEREAVQQKAARDSASS